MSTNLFDRDGHWHCRTAKEESTCMGYRFVIKYNYPTGKSYMSIFSIISATLAGNSLLRTRNFATMAK